MKTRYTIRDLWLDGDGLMLYGEEDGHPFYIIVPKRLVRRFFVLILRAMR